MCLWQDEAKRRPTTGAADVINNISINLADTHTHKHTHCSKIRAKVLPAPAAAGRGRGRGRDQKDISNNIK